MKKEIKNFQLQIRVSEAQKAWISKSARKSGMGVSEWVLSQVIPDRQLQFNRLCSELKKSDQPRYVLAELHDMLNSASSAEFELMVAQSPDKGLSEYLMNYVAAMVEYAANKKGALAPAWTRDVPPLDKPHFGVDLKSLRLHLLTHSPPPFRRRNIFIDSSVGERV